VTFQNKVHDRRSLISFVQKILRGAPTNNSHGRPPRCRSGHKPRHDAWLARHPNVHFHLTLTHANWLNLIECWFSIQVRAASFTSPQQLREALDKFIRKYNQAAVPLAWTKEGGALGSPKTSLGAFCAIKY
jgi:hypothetical protein